MVHILDKALALGHYATLGLMLYLVYVPIGHDLCITYTLILGIAHPWPTSLTLCQIGFHGRALHVCSYTMTSEMYDIVG